ncbi:MAG TPA: type III restriction endonuclease subunit R [Hydrogenophaga sp.]|uniref:type I restriction endonuclease subunit R n=1 Tax=Hydrogenophaga sp. TaxID=1904254 RepID=UPI0008B3DA5B|nr:type I restriction-modification enzyme R subunit C-terminal domain-containing protein [Hydrogenophaga sp.]OGA77843.1 MAG: type III restriction endonuclease subunit R [Burkholderiales bacterium GWE1_65_30]OGA94193.1 MAG: type III restriction endonuclease subunit R [Burkholderiales bacterium GWF1_66_17]HAX20568.1 type III restriction endonuclease subunit R [Hydrogenophaga sp.]HBU19226.1 type III restriction endonuclease subunit R [Hydrogenophaga sp.]
MTPEARARQTIDTLLTAAGWHVCNVANANIHAGGGAVKGVAIREFPLNPGHGFADYLLYVNGKACGVIEAKKEGATLSGVEVQSARYAQGLPAALPAWRRPLPFVFESTGVETRFTNGLDPAPRARPLFAFFRPELLLLWLKTAEPPSPNHIALGTEPTAEPPSGYLPTGTFLARLQHMPPLVTEWGQGGASYQLWPAQIKAIQNLETSLAANKPKALIQMATGSGKTFTAISFIYRLIKFGGARRVLFLVDRGNLARQTKKEFDAYASPHNAYKFGEEFIVQHLQGNQLDGSARVVICTIQRMFSMLKGKDLPEEADEESTEGAEALFKDPEPIGYNPAIPIESFDIVVTDEAHRSIYNLWRQVLEYFDAYLIGLTATPNKQTFGFFNQNLVMEYGHAQAVADGVNVNYDVYRIKTEVTEAGAKVDKGYWLETQDKATRRKTAWQLDEDFEYDPTELDRAVQTPDQIRTVVRTLRDQWRVDLFPQRQELPKTLIFAKDDNHAEKIVEILREEFARGNEFAQKITYRTTGASPEQLIKDFRTAYYPRVAVTVDMIATGTDIKPVEIVMFMRSVKSRSFFEQMKGRGVRVCQPTDLMAVNPGEQLKKDHFVIVDCVGVCERDKTDSRPMDQKKSVPLDKLLQAVALGNVEDEVLSSVAARLSRLGKDISEADHAKVIEASGGHSLQDLARGIVNALNLEANSEDQSPAQLETTLRQAAQPFSNPALRELILKLKQKADLIIDTVTSDKLVSAGFTEGSDRAQALVQSFEAFIQQHKDEITALQILYNRPVRAPLRFEDIQALADALHSPPHLIDESALWQAYAALQKGKVKGSNQKRLLTDIVSLVRFAMQQDNELVPYPERVQANFKAWLAQHGQPFTPEQQHWLEMIRDHIAANLGIDIEDFSYAPFEQEGGLGKVHRLFGAELPQVIETLNRELAA